MRVIGLILLSLATGCVGVERAPPQTSVPSSLPGVAEAPAKTTTEENKIAKIEVPEAQTSTIPPPPSPASAKLPRKKPDADVTPAPGKPAAKPAAASPSAPALDLTMLENRLKETKAIGVFTKLTLKNQVDDLLNQFREYYQGKVKTTLAELRQPYDRLLLKVLTLLQEGDPELARAIVASREAIWSILADPAKFATL
ncbi:MAG TPA: hypothetical protein VIR61_03165 [Sulfuricaulis sp.]